MTYYVSIKYEVKKKTIPEHLNALRNMLKYERQNSRALDKENYLFVDFNIVISYR